VQVLKQIEPFPHSWVDPDVGPLEDAAVVRPENGTPLVFTVDFITPIVDDPETFGAIAAANALSDVYAMGGEPQVALAVCGYPEDKVSTGVLARIFRGARDKAAEAGCAIVGGHTVIDPELKYGLCVIGRVDGERTLAQTHAREGDRLVLTKPLGFGIAAQAIKQDALSPRDRDAAVAAMLVLNKGAKDAALEAGARAATDVTGFGMLGHLHHLLLACGLAAEVHSSAVPALECARPLAAEERVPGGTLKNRAYVEPHTHFDAQLPPGESLLLCDAQTSGGLLIAVPPDREAALLSALEAAATPARAVVGEIVAGEPGRLRVCS
jgi:selenide,water dikinase